MSLEARRRLPRRQRLEELCAATLRSMTGHGRLHFEGGGLFDGELPVRPRAPHLRLAGLDAGLDEYRSVADAMALRLMYSDADLHAGLAPDEPVQRLVFDWLEQLRVESLAPESLPGLRHNLERHYRAWSGDFLDSGATESSLGMLMFALSQIVWSRLNACELPEIVQDLLEPTRAALGPALGVALAGMRRWRADQARFAAHALDVARDIAQRVQSVYEDEPETAGSRGRYAFNLWLDAEDEGEDQGLAAADSGESAVFLAGRGQYRVYTRRYDQQVPAEELLRAALLSEYRERLDQRIACQGVNVNRLARRLQAALAHPERDGWRFGEEEGVIDGRRLAQLISSPSERRLFRRDRYRPVSDCVVSLLIDCSGSMKRCIESVAVLADILMRALEQGGTATEILGFTTAAWNGGRARQDWLAAGRASHPGRLGELRHIVFKEAGVSWRRARRPLAALLKADLFREGVDGEAVQWACARLARQDCRRRILLVVSDGCPMDTATNLANDVYYLDNHLKAVVGQQLRRGIEIYGLGVGLDLSPYYPDSLAVDLSERLDNKVFDDFTQMLMQARRGSRLS